MASISDINNDCLVAILSFLPSNDLNAVAECNQPFREARGHESLDQTRTGTINCSESPSLVPLYTVLARCARNGVFTGNRTSLKFVCLERIRDLCEHDAEGCGGPDHFIEGVALTQVTSVEISCNPETREKLKLPMFRWRLLSPLLPNIREICLENIEADEVDANSLCDGLPYLMKMKWMGSVNAIDFIGNSFPSPHVTELYLDDTRFSSCLFTMCLDVSSCGTRMPANWTAKRFNDLNDEVFVMWRECPNLGRVSMKGATWIPPPLDETTHVTFSVTQNMLIKLVRHLGFVVICRRRILPC